MILGRVDVWCRKNRMKKPQSIILNRTFFFISLCLLSLFSIIISLDCGAFHLGLLSLFKVLFTHHYPLQKAIVLKLRLPRTLSAFVTGGLLAFAGVLMQTLLRNPLADPYILGVSGGAALMTLLGMLFGIGGFYLNCFSLLGAFFSIFLVFILARCMGHCSSTRLLLTGIVVASGWAALISFILVISPNRLLHNMLFWLIGDLSYSHFPGSGLVILAFGVCLGLGLARQLNILSHGEVQAKSLGVNTKILFNLTFFLSALLTATAVSIAGTIAFVGLVIPHMVRLLIGSDHRFVIPGSILLGGSLLVLADTLGRIILAPQQIPVGIITTFIGVPVFLILLSRGYQQWR